MKIAIYSPYLDTFGGGERYILTMAEILSKDSSVDLLFDNNLYTKGADNLKSRLSARFNIDLSSVNTLHAPIGKGSNIVERLYFFRKYDVLIYLTDGSIFYPTAKKNILHIQSPIIGQPSNTFLGKYKLKGWDFIIYNSNFTKQNCSKYWPIKSVIIYPPVNTDKIKPLKKKKYILSVGRFFGYLRDKKHEILIKAFRDLYLSKKIENWSLHLVGSASEGDKEYVNLLKEMSEGLPVKIYPNLSYGELISMYGESSLYWHAAGFGEEEPAKMEHFGITTVEAMSGGCVPVVIGKGGQVEIVEDGKSGYLWNTLDQLKQYSLKLISNNELWKEMSYQAEMCANKFSKNIFEEKIIENITNKK